MEFSAILSSWQYLYFFGLFFRAHVMLFGFLVIRVNSFWGILLNAQATVVVMVNRIHSPMLFSMCCVVTGGKCIQCVCPSVRLDALYANANNQPSIVNVFFVCVTLCQKIQSIRDFLFTVLQFVPTYSYIKPVYHVGELHKPKST